MADAGKTPWWQTVPAILTGVAALLTALAALLGILYQIGVFAPKSEASIAVRKSDATISAEQGLAAKAEQAPARKVEQIPRATTIKPRLSVAELYQSFGLFGIWAVDCNEPATPKNPHVVIVMPPTGPVYETHDLGNTYAKNRYNITAAKRVGDDRLWVQSVFEPGTREQTTSELIFRIRNNTRQTISNLPEGSAIRVQNGTKSNDGGPTAILYKCG
jgi:hypothetical protein